MASKLLQVAGSTSQPPIVEVSKSRAAAQTVAALEHHGSIGSLQHRISSLAQIGLFVSPKPGRKKLHPRGPGVPAVQREAPSPCHALPLGPESLIRLRSTAIVAKGVGSLTRRRNWPRHLAPYWQAATAHHPSDWDLTFHLPACKENNKTSGQMLGGLLMIDHGPRGCVKEDPSSLHRRQTQQEKEEPEADRTKKQQMAGDRDATNKIMAEKT